MSKVIDLDGTKVSLDHPCYVIAEIGNNPEGDPILHFEIRLDGNPTDPLVILPSPY